MILNKESLLGLCASLQNQKKNLKIKSSET